MMILCVLSAGCGGERNGEDGKKRLEISLGKRITSLDPALAADTASQYMVGAFYDTPLQYSYRKRPYQLECSMLAELPKVSTDMRIFRWGLRDDVYFQESACFPDKPSRKVTGGRLVFSMLRLADSRVRSSGYWLIRGKIKGIEAGFRKQTETAEKDDFSP